MQHGAITFAYVIEHCKPSAKILRLTEKKVNEAEQECWCMYPEV